MTSLQRWFKKGWFLQSVHFVETWLKEKVPGSNKNSMFEDKLKSATMYFSTTACSDMTLSAFSILFIFWQFWGYSLAPAIKFDKHLLSSFQMPELVIPEMLNWVKNNSCSIDFLQITPKAREKGIQIPDIQRIPEIPSFYFLSRLVK